MFSFLKNSRFLLACSESGSSGVAWNCCCLLRAVPYIGQEVRPRASGEKEAEEVLSLLALDAELDFRRNCARTTERESRLKRAKLRHELVPPKCACQGESKNSSVQNERRRYGNPRDQKQKCGERRQRTEFGALGTEFCGAQASNFGEGWPRILEAAQASEIGLFGGRRDSFFAKIGRVVHRLSPVSFADFFVCRVGATSTGSLGLLYIIDICRTPTSITSRKFLLAFVRGDSPSAFPVLPLRETTTHLTAWEGALY
jgi:hypothetical protein